LSTAHTSKTPHHVGQIAKAQITAAGMLEDWGSPHADDRGKALVTAFQDLGWTPPRDLAEHVPLRPEQIADPDGPGRRAFRAARAALAQRAAPPSTTDGRNTNQRATLSTPDEAPSETGDRP